MSRSSIFGWVALVALFQVSGYVFGLWINDPNFSPGLCSIAGGGLVIYFKAGSFAMLPMGFVIGLGFVCWLIIEVAGLIYPDSAEALHILLQRNVDVLVASGYFLGFCLLLAWLLKGEKKQVEKE